MLTSAQPEPAVCRVYTYEGIHKVHVTYVKLHVCTIVHGRYAYMSCMYVKIKKIVFNVQLCFLITIIKLHCSIAIPYTTRTHTFFSLFSLSLSLSSFSLLFSLQLSSPPSLLSLSFFSATSDKHFLINLDKVLHPPTHKSIASVD